MLWIRLNWSSDSNVELWRSSNWLCRTKQWWFIAMKTFMNVIFQLRLSKLNMDVQNEVHCTLCKLHWKYPGQIFFAANPNPPNLDANPTPIAIPISVKSREVAETHVKELRFHHGSKKKHGKVNVPKKWGIWFYHPVKPICLLHRTNLMWLGLSNFDNPNTRSCL